jgi:type IV pilus assembly protein PilQ
MRRHLSILGLLTFLVCFGGCATDELLTLEEKSTEPIQLGDAPAALDKAKALYEQGDYEAALSACVDLARARGHVEGLPELRAKVLQALVDQRTEALRFQDNESQLRMDVEALENEQLPDTYGALKRVEGEKQSHITAPGKMATVLDTPVSMHLKGVDLSTFIAAISEDKKINMIADKGLAKGVTMDIEMDAVPLKDVFGYVSRNLDVSFHVGENVIWVTKPLGKGGVPPMETRIYRLNAGLPFHAESWKSADPKEEEKYAANGALPSLTIKATDAPKVETSIETVMKRFVPEVAGSQFYVDSDAHVVIARNTRENLALIEAMLQSLDVVPPQVLIEARFIETTVSDLRELGIEWMLDTPIGDGQGHIRAGNAVNFDPYTSDDGGTFPLGPQGDFGASRSGNPATSSQGMNLTYQGVLTDPMFRVVLHALDISGNGHTLSVPRVTTVNNSPAKLRNGSDLMYFDEFQAQAFNLVDANNLKYTITVLIPKGKPQKEELGITLVAVPSVGADMKTITLILMPTISALDGWIDYQDMASTNSVDDIRQVVAKLPIFSRKEIQTKVITESGQTVVLGGLISTVKQDTLHAVPFLSQIPFIGSLFRRQDVTEQRRNLLIFVTATVISERGEKLVPFFSEP